MRIADQFAGLPRRDPATMSDGTFRPLAIALFDFHQQGYGGQLAPFWEQVVAQRVAHDLPVQARLFVRFPECRLARV